MTALSFLGSLFRQVLTMSLTAVPVLAVILLARLALRGAPKKFSYWLWAVGAFRLLCPVSIPAVFSLFSLLPGKTVSQGGPLTQVSYLPADTTAPAPPVSPAGGEALAQSAPALSLWEVLGLTWALGVGVMLLLAAVSALLTLRQVSTAVKLYYHVYESDRIRSPFVLGLVKPRIYLPFGLAPRQREYVLCHETVHIRRKDYLIKPLGFLVLALHWFNPLVWLSFHLMSRDMEMSCDEKVLSQLGEEVRRDYSLSLLSIGMNRRFAFPDPLGFGETGVKERVRNVMKFHKAKTWVTAAAAAAVVLLAAACSVNPGASQLEAHTEEILQAWLTQPDETLRDLALPDGARTQEEMDAQEEELYARFEELFPREYFTDTGYESFRSTVLAGAMYHLRVGEGAMELTDLVPNGEEQTKDTWQWVAQVRMDCPEKEPQDISILVSVQEEGGKIASLRLDQQDAGQISAYFGDGPFPADDQVQEKIEQAEAEQQDAFDKMQTAQEEIDRLEEEREAGEDVASQLEEAQSQWDQEFERYSQAAQDAYEAGDTQVQSQPEETVEGGFEAERAEGGEEPPLLEEGGVEVEQPGGTEEPPLPEEGGVEVERIIIG